MSFGLNPENKVLLRLTGESAAGVAARGLDDLVSRRVVGDIRSRDRRA